MSCTTCGGPWVMLARDVAVTLGGVVTSPCGRPHNQNCLTRIATCALGHQTVVSLQQTCPCGWRGKTTCSVPGCHPGTKLAAWPRLPVEAAAPRDAGPPFAVTPMRSGESLDLTRPPSKLATVGDALKKREL